MHCTEGEKGLALPLARCLAKWGGNESRMISDATVEVGTSSGDGEVVMVR